MTTVLRYRALAHALWSLRTPSFFEEARPVERAVPYRARAPSGVAPLLDVYLPTASTGASAVLVHGGGFVIGSREMKPMRFLASSLTRAGAAVCTIDYRLVFRGGRLDEAVDDVRTALAFWRDRAPRYDLDPARISLVGLSAGATLAMLAASSEEDTSLGRLVCVFGLYDPTHLTGPLAHVLPRLLFGTPERERWLDRSPVRCRQPRVPTLMLHGTADGLVPVEQAQRLAAHRESQGLPTRLVLYPGAPHGFFNYPSPVASEGAREIASHVLGTGDDAEGIDAHM